MKGCSISPAKSRFKHTHTSPALVITTGQIYFQLLFNLSSIACTNLYIDPTQIFNT